jgi:DNA uptake protein ComE-like DNA-binding protein
MNAPESYQPRVPSDLMPPVRAAVSASWALLPILTIGWATPFTFAIAALWRRSVPLVMAAAFYLGVFAVQVVLYPKVYPDTGTSQDHGAQLLFNMCMLVQAVVGCVHAFLVRRRVFDPDGLAGTNETAVAQVRKQRALRQKARELAGSDPGLARELRIGRPDLARRYDDGGLVDVNHAPVSALVTLPGITPELAARIDAMRTEVGGFMSAEELSAVAALPPALTPDLAEHALFLP